MSLLAYFSRKFISFKKMIRRFKCWGSFRRMKPFSHTFGYDRGNQSIARYYIDGFFQKHKNDIHGNVLEIGDDVYTKRFGSNLEIFDVLHVQEGNLKATIVTDLTKDIQIPGNKYDCIVIPQTFHVIYDFRTALLRCYDILKPDGVLLATLSGISQLSRYDMNRWGDYWRFTSLSAKKVFEEVFPPENIDIEVHGNVLSAVGFLEGLASRELRKSELDYKDPDYELIITIRAVKQ